MSRYHPCAWTVDRGPLSDPRECGKPATSRYCAEHQARIPFWPVEPPPAVQMPEGKP